MGENRRTTTSGGFGGALSRRSRSEFIFRKSGFWLTKKEAWKSTSSFLMNPRSLIPMILLTAVSHLTAATLTVDQTRSAITVDAKATAHSFRGKLTKFNATVSGDPVSMKPSVVALDWDFSDLKTGEAKRDSEMLKWLGQTKGSFRMTKSWVDADGKSWVQGNLKIHGVSQSISFPMKATRKGDQMTVDGAVWIDYQNFSLPIIRNMAVMTVDPKLKISFHLEGDIK